MTSHFRSCARKFTKLPQQITTTMQRQTGEKWKQVTCTVLSEADSRNGIKMKCGYLRLAYLSFLKKHGYLRFFKLCQ